MISLLDYTKMNDMTIGFNISCCYL